VSTRVDINGRTRQGATLARSSGRELVWGLRAVSGEVSRWRAHADRIPDPQLRADALAALARKRGSIDGAALFWTLPDRRSRELLRALVAYEVLADFLDCVSERGAGLGIENGRQLHLALVEALDPQAGISDYYRHHRSGGDGGYARALVQSCRRDCERLPSYEPLRPFLMRAAGHSGVLAINHEPDPARRERGLREWALRERAGDRAASVPVERSWYERAAGSSAWVTVLAMLALAAEPRRAAGEWAHDDEVARTYDAYVHWIAPTGALLDSFADVLEDRCSGDHSYLAHYPSMDVAVARLSELVRRSRSEARTLPAGARHAVLLSSMIAFFLSKDSLRTPELCASARRLRRAGGPLVALLVPVLRLWRTAYGQRSA
jgi:tetraprenyl-beta-curcumene synthase